MTDYDGRIELPPPSLEALARAAEDVLGPTASEAMLTEGGKIFRGMGGYFLQGPAENVGEIISHASRELQDRLMSEAQMVRHMKAVKERAKYNDPKTNPMIKLGD